MPGEIKFKLTFPESGQFGALVFQNRLFLNLKFKVTEEDKLYDTEDINLRDFREYMYYSYFKLDTGE